MTMDKKYEDKMVQCMDCQNMFTLTTGEQEFYNTKMDDNGKPMKEPKRCRVCRKSRKIRMNSPFRGVAGQLRRNEIARAEHSDPNFIEEISEKREPDDFTGATDDPNR